MDSELQDLRYPVGRFTTPAMVSAADLHDWIDGIERLPAALRATVQSLGPQQLATPYRPEGWTVRQVVHHLADSHANSLIRFKLALTEDCPTIKPYREELWAELADSRDMPISTSLHLLDALHERWVCLLRSMSAADLAREFVHPASGKIRLDVNIGLYAWHGRHHLAQISGLAAREGWSSSARGEG